MDIDEFNERFLNKPVRIVGLHPGKDSPAYSHSGVLEQTWATADGCIAFSACRHTWIGVDYWREMNGELIGFYAAGVYPESEPGIIRIVLDEQSDGEK